MLRSLFVLIMAAGAAFSQYKVEPAGPPPSGLAASTAALLQKDGSKVLAGNGTAFCEIWFRTTVPSGPKATEEGISLPTIPQGALLGALRFPAKAPIAAVRISSPASIRCDMPCSRLMATTRVWRRNVTFWS